MSLFVEPTVCRLTPDEWATLSKPIDGDGGHQGLLRTILDTAANVDGGMVVTVEDDELITAYRYAYDYQDGGYQARFKALLQAAFRAGWVPPQ